MDVETIDRAYNQLDNQSQQTIQALTALAQKLQVAVQAGDQNAREWMLDLNEIAVGIKESKTRSPRCYRHSTALRPPSYNPQSRRRTRRRPISQRRFSRRHTSRCRRSTRSRAIRVGAGCCNVFLVEVLVRPLRLERGSASATILSITYLTDRDIGGLSTGSKNRVVTNRLECAESIYRRILANRCLVFLCSCKQ